MKSLRDISWLVTEEEYRADLALSYSTLARYEREGFNNLDKLFDKIEIKLNSKYAKGKSFVIETENNSRDSYYIQSAELNGKPLSDCWIYRENFFNGGVLKLKMGKTPNYEWGVGNAPYYGK